MLKFLISVFVLLLAGKSYAEGFDNTEYDLYKETQFANGFALIKDSYGKRLSPQHDEKNYADGIMHASVLFGEMDLLNIKKQVIEKMDDSVFYYHARLSLEYLLCRRAFYGEKRKDYFKTEYDGYRNDGVKQRHVCVRQRLRGDIAEQKRRNKLRYLQFPYLSFSGESHNADKQKINNDRSYENSYHI